MAVFQSLNFYVCERASWLADWDESQLCIEVDTISLSQSACSDSFILSWTRTNNLNGSAKSELDKARTKL